MKIIVAGGSGFIGKHLVHQLLEDKHSVLLLTRNTSHISEQHPLLSIAEWDGKSPGHWTKHIDGADAVINLSGESIAEGRWTSSRKQKLRSSRLDSTRALVKAIQNASKKPTVYISASGVGFYGDVPDGNVTETAPAGSGFLAELCREWEDEVRKVEQYNARPVMLRLGVVLDKKGGAMERLVLPFKLFAGGWLGSGKQGFPWIHIDDVIGVITFALKHSSLSGPVNVASPKPLTMKEFSKILGSVLQRPCWAPVPSAVLKIMLGELSGMLLTGQHIIPQKLLNTGYQFRYPDLKIALENIFKS